MVAHFAWDEGVARSNRVIPTICKEFVEIRTLFLLACKANNVNPLIVKSAEVEAEGRMARAIEGQHIKNHAFIHPYPLYNPTLVIKKPQNGAENFVRCKIVI